MNRRPAGRAGCAASIGAHQAEEEQDRKHEPDHDAAERRTTPPLDPEPLPEPVGAAVGPAPRCLGARRIRAGDAVAGSAVAAGVTSAIGVGVPGRGGLGRRLWRGLGVGFGAGLAAGFGVALGGP